MRRIFYGYNCTLGPKSGPVKTRLTAPVVPPCTEYIPTTSMVLVGWAGLIHV